MPLWLSRLLLSAAQTVRDFICIAPDDVRFKSPLGIGPEQTAPFGDLSKPGLYVIRVRFPPGAHVDLHFNLGLGAFEPIFGTSIETFAG